MLKTTLLSAGKKVIIGDELPTVLVGERINPTGKKKLSSALQAGDLDIVRTEALGQVEAGADVLDVNAGITECDEASLLAEVVQLVCKTVDVPLCIDSKDPSALEAGLKVYAGKALINSVTGEEESLKEVLPLAKSFGAAVVGLTVDDRGIPTDASQRLEIAGKIVRSAEAMGISREDVIIDCLVMTLGADNNAGLITLDSIRKIKSELGVNMTFGASNISFGVPDRDLLNNAFLAIAIAAGINCPIVDAAKSRATILAADFAMGKDFYAKRYSKAYRERIKG